MKTRGNISVIGIDGSIHGNIAMPTVFTAPIRPDIIHLVHTNLAKNHRQPYAVSSKAGHQTSAQSWGTGRAVSRIPRVPGGGTQRSGHGAIGNMCRKGHMYAPTKKWRRWHRKLNINIKRYAIASALAVSSIPAMVMSRGHRIENLPELPLVIDDELESISTTSKAFESLKCVGAAPELDRIIASIQIHRGRGKLRNRRHVKRKGPMIVYANDNGITRAFRNLPGVNVAKVDCLNLLDLAPGGHLGRFLIWTKAAVEALKHHWSRRKTLMIENEKKGDIIKQTFMNNSDLNRLINSDEVQSVLRAPKDQKYNKRAPMKKNPFLNKGTMIKLNPYSIIESKPKMKTLQWKYKNSNKTSAFFYKQLLADTEYRCSDCLGFRTWLGL
jgi:large subunit ribosomal protein L4e